MYTDVNVIGSGHILGMTVYFFQKLFWMYSKKFFEYIQEIWGKYSIVMFLDYPEWREIPRIMYSLAMIISRTKSFSMKLLRAMQLHIRCNGIF